MRTVQVGASELQGSTVAVIVTGETSFDRIWLSYALVSLGSRQFAAYGGFQQITPSQSIYSVLKGFADPQLAFFGINGFNLTSSNTSAAISVDADFYLTATTAGNFNAFTSSYLFVGLPGASPCSECSIRGEGTRYIGGFCLPECPDYTEQVLLPGGGSLCRRCLADLGQVGVGGKCVCMSGFVNSGGKCEKQSASNLLPSSGFVNQPNLQPASPALDTASVYNAASPSQPTMATQSQPVQNIQQVQQTAQPAQPSQFVQPAQPFQPAQIMQPNQLLQQPSSISTVSTASNIPVFTPTPPTFPPLVNNPSVAVLSPAVPNPQQISASTITAGFNMISQAISSTAGNCILPFTYWNGNECICQVGY